MIKKGEMKFICYERVLKLFLPLGIVLSLINYSFIKIQWSIDFIMVNSFKMLLILLIGYLEGKFEWSFYQRIFGPSVNTISSLRKRYVINKGILTFGLPLGIINFWLSNSNFIFEYVRLSIWLIIGVIFGAILWRINKKSFEQIINH